MIAVLATAALCAQGKAPDKAAAIDALVKKLSNDDAKERLKALDSLGGMGAGAKPAAYAVCKCVVEDFREDVRAAAAKALARIRPDLAPNAVTLKSSNDDKAMTAAAEKIGKLGDDGVAGTPALIICINRHDRKSQSDSPVVAACIRALGEVKPSEKDVAHQLGQAVALNASAEIRETAARTLGKIGVAHVDLRKPILSYLKIGMRDRVTEVRVASLQAAGSFGPDAKTLLPAVRVATKDENADVQKAAADAVAAIEKKDK